jgi:hypothetical protein
MIAIVELRSMKSLPVLVSISELAYRQREKSRKGAMTG